MTSRPSPRRRRPRPPAYDEEGDAPAPPRRTAAGCCSGRSCRSTTTSTSSPLYVDPEDAALDADKLRDRRQPRGQGPQQRRHPAVDLDRPHHPPRPDRVAHRAAGELRRAALVRHLLQRVPGQLLAALDRRQRRHADGQRRPVAARPSSSTVDGQRPVAARRLGETGSEAEGTFTFDLPLKPFVDGGWYWYDVVAGDDDVVVESAEWTAEVPEDRPTTAPSTSRSPR